MNNKTCNMCTDEKQIENLYKQYAESKDCNSRSGLKRYYDNKENISNQRKIFYKKNQLKILHKKTIDIYILKTQLDPTLH